MTFYLGYQVTGFNVFIVMLKRNRAIPTYQLFLSVALESCAGDVNTTVTKDACTYYATVNRTS